MLVVVATVAVLASLLLAAVSQTRARIQSTHCLVRLSQLGMGLSMLVNDEDYYPSVYAIRNGNSWVGWSQLVLGYAGDDSRMLMCPSLPGESYHYNGYGSGGPSHKPNLGLGGDSAEEPLASSGVKVPSDMIALTDVVYLSFPPRIRRASPHLPPHRSYPHNDGLNVVFCDGHVEYAKRHRLVAPTDQARRRWNNDNLSHPETW